MTTYMILQLTCQRVKSSFDSCSFFLGYQHVSFTPTAESHGFSPDRLWSGLWPGCRATKSSGSRSESVEPSGATGRSTWRLSTGFPVGLHKNRRKKAPRTLRLWSFLEKPYVGIADPQWNSVPHVPEILP